MKSLLNQLPSARVAHDSPDPIVWVCLTCVNSGYRYYICGYDAEFDVIWGLKVEREAKLGYLLLGELDGTEIRIEVTSDALPCRLSELVDYLHQNEGVDEIRGWSD
jgi:hypothetical protein